MCFYMFTGLKLGSFMLHWQWKKEKVTEFMCVCVWDVPPAGWLSLIDLWSLGNAFILETADEADGEEDDEKKEEEKNAKNWDMMEITGTVLTIPYWRWMFTFFVNYIANAAIARTFFGIPVHKFPFIHLFHFPKPVPVSVPSDTYLLKTPENISLCCSGLKVMNTN